METEKNLRNSIEKLKADASGILVCVSKLKGLKKHNEMVEASIEKRSQEVDLKEKELQKLGLDLEERVKRFEAEKAEAGDLKKLVEECTDELRAKRNDLSAKLDSSMRIQRDIELRNKHLGQVMAELKRRCGESRNVQVRQRQMEEEIDGKKKELGLIVAKVGESKEKLEEVCRQVELKKGEFFEAEKREADLKVKCDGLKKDVEEKGKELDVVKSRVESWERKLIHVKKLVNDSTADLSSRKDQVEKSEADLKVKADGLNKDIEEKGKELDVVKSEVESWERKLIHVKKLVSDSTADLSSRKDQAEKSEADLKVKSDGLNKNIEEKGKELDVVKSQVESWERKLILVKEQFNDATAELSSRNDQVDSSKKKQSGKTKIVIVKHKGVERILQRRPSILQPSSHSIEERTEDTGEKLTFKRGINMLRKD